jgi:hypothetical protein
MRTVGKPPKRNIVLPHPAMLPSAKLVVALVVKPPTAENDHNASLRVIGPKEGRASVVI